MTPTNTPAPATTTAALTGGFADAPVQSARAFRTALDVMARPGTIGLLSGARPPAPLSVAAGTLLLTLSDATTPVYLAPGHDSALIRDWLRFHTGAPLAPRTAAVFAIGTWDALLPLTDFAIGTAEYPDRAATLIIERPQLLAEGAALRGPGIADLAHLSLPEGAETVFRCNRALFPLGIDCFLTAGAQVAALPRSTIVGDV